MGPSNMNEFRPKALPILNPIGFGRPSHTSNSTRYPPFGKLVSSTMTKPKVPMTYTLTPTKKKVSALPIIGMIKTEPQDSETIGQLNNPTNNLNMKPTITQNHKPGEIINTKQAHSSKDNTLPRNNLPANYMISNLFPAHENINKSVYPAVHPISNMRPTLGEYYPQIMSILVPNNSSPNNVSAQGANEQNADMPSLEIQENEIKSENEMGRQSFPTHNFAENYADGTAAVSTSTRQDLKVSARKAESIMRRSRPFPMRNFVANPQIQPSTPQIQNSAMPNAPMNFYRPNPMFTFNPPMNPYLPFIALSKPQSPS